MRKERLVEIRSDVFDIADRMKEVDERYLLFYNLDKARFEVRLKGREEEIAVTWQGALDARLLTKLRETHVRRRDELIKEIERSEAMAQAKEDAARREKIGVKSEEFMRANWKSR